MASMQSKGIEHNNQIRGGAFAPSTMMMTMTMTMKMMTMMTLTRIMMTLAMMTTTAKMMIGGSGKMRTRRGGEVTVMSEGGEAAATHATIKC